MKKPTDYSPTQRVIIETDYKPLGLAEAAKLGVVLTESQAVALAFVIACSTAALEHVVRGFCADLPAPEYNLEFEHPTHTWGRWARAVENDETLPGESYSEWVSQHLPGGEVTISGVLYSGDAGTLAALEGYYPKNGSHMKRGYTMENFLAFVESRRAEGRLRVVAGPTPTAAQVEKHFQQALSSGEHEPGDAVPFTDEELADLDDDDDDMTPPNELAYEHL